MGRVGFQREEGYMSERAVGIDLGTTRTSIASIISGRSEAADNREGSKRTPSVVHFRKDGKVEVGERAFNLAILARHHVVTDSKRIWVSEPHSGGREGPR